jgi:predicted Zn-dependent protease
MRRLLLILVTLALLATGLPGCIIDPVTGERKLGKSMSDEREADLGAKYAVAFSAMYEGAYPDRDLQDYCGRIVLGMAKQSHRPGLPWTFKILNSSQVNAFALPGGKVFITRGLLWKLESEAQFVGVMGHEIGHVSHKHGLQSMGRAELAGGLISLAGTAAEQYGGDIGKLGVGLGAKGVQVLLLKYSRDQESESDQRGVEYSHQAGYDPREMAGVFEIFKELKGGKSPPVWLSSHPLDDDRIAAVHTEVAQRFPEIGMSDGRGLTKSSPGWSSRIDRLRQAQKVYDVYDQASAAFAKAQKEGDESAYSGVLAKLAECERRLPGHALFTSGSGVALYHAGRAEEARKKLERAASLQADLFEPPLYLAQIALDRRDHRAVHAHADRALQILPDHPHPYFLQARAYDAEGNGSKAVAFYEEVMKRTPADSEVHQRCAKRVKELSGVRPTDAR